MNKQLVNTPEVLITAGGTRESVDDVRYLGNFSGGRFGHALAGAYANLGHSVLLLAPNIVVERFGLPNGVEHQDFTSADSLRTRILAVPAARLILHAAAVADYTPKRVEGKISSDGDEIVMHLHRVPKILPDLREHFGESSEIVGFKLLSGVTEPELIDTAVKQIATSRTDKCIANDLQELKQSRRLHVVAPNGDYETLEGETQAIAYDVASIIKIKNL